MSKKNIIQSVIIFLGFLGSAIVLYNGFHHPAPPAIVPNAGSAAVSAVGGGSGKILPFGNSLNFKALDEQNLQYGLMSYPVLNPNTEVGINESALINVLPAPTGTKH